MYERFTDRARKIMQFANEEAMRFKHEYVGTEHVLLGLIKEGSGVAANVLLNLNIDLGRIRREVEKIVLAGPEMVAISILPQTPRVKRVIEFAMEEARNLKHNYVGSEHLLLGLVRENEGVAAQVLMNLGLSLQAVRNEVLNLLGHNLEDLPAKPAEESELSESEIKDLPENARKIVNAFDALIECLQQVKEAAVSQQEWEKAACLRDHADAVKKLRTIFIRSDRKWF